MNKGKVIIISAPSGTGKGTVIARLLEVCENLALSVSATTRAPRTGETDGVHYSFITREEFRKLADEGKFLEYAEYAGNCYGTPLPPILDKIARGINVILEIEVKGFKQVKEKMPEAVSVFLIPPSMEELERRLRSRGTDSEETIVKRLEIARTEMALSEKYDYIVVNDDVDAAVGEIIKIINIEQESEAL